MIFLFASHFQIFNKFMFTKFLRYYFAYCFNHVFMALGLNAKESKAAADCEDGIG
jgi:hypothetical protein